MHRLIGSFWASRCLYVIAELGIPDLLRDGPRGIGELAELTRTKSPNLSRVLRALTSVGVFDLDEFGRFGLTPLGSTLRSDVPGSLRARAIDFGGDENYRAWGNLLHTVRTGEIGFNHAFGKSPWEYMAEHPLAAKRFDESMANGVRVLGGDLAKGYPFTSFEKVVDVGGGDGTLMVMLLTANPNLMGVIFDQPHVAQSARTKITTAGLEGRCEVINGDFFASVPRGGDAYLLSRVIHDWDDPHSVTILTNCRRAMQKDGKLLVIERVLPDVVRRSPAVQSALMSDLNMMVVNGGRERTSSEYRTLFEKGGFKLARILPVGPTVSVLEGTPA